MAQELNSISKVAIIGGGPAGCMCAYFLQDKFNVTVFEKNVPLATLLPTGGGRCNLGYAEFDPKELAKNYPRGEKFLYSVFSKFSTGDTIEFFEKIGVKTYVQDDMRIFPESNSAKDVREKFLKALRNVRFVKEDVSDINSSDYDYTVIATGGHGVYSLIPEHTIISPKPALTGLKTTEKLPQGVSIKNVSSCGFVDDILFTHEGISGPLVYKISSVKARENFPYTLTLRFCDDFDMQLLLNQKPHKSIKNLLAEIIPKSFAVHILNVLGISEDTKCYCINGETRDKIMSKLISYEVEVVGVSSGGEVVTCGGVELSEINSKTMESKLVPNLYFCGEVLDIDGFCGGFNLQNCWSTAYVAAMGIKNSFKV